MSGPRPADDAVVVSRPAAVEMTGIDKRFPGVVANDGVHLSAAAGEVHALLGENGAGKSTLSNILSGLYRPDAGTIALDGVPVSFGSPREALAAGVGMVHQHFRLVPSFTVAENIALGDDRDGRLRIGRRALEESVVALGEQFGLLVDPTARIWQLSVGEQQRVEILKVLAREARYLILDEPTAVLTPQEANALFVTLRAMVDGGRTVIFISHKLDEVMAVSDRVTVLRGGRNAGTVDTASTSPRALARLMVGRDVVFSGIRRASSAPGASSSGPPVLDVRSLGALDDRGRPAVVDVSFAVGVGEIVGIAGVSGNGQRELAETLSGMRPATSGTVSVDGVALRTGRVADALRAGIRHVPEDRLHTGLAAGLSIESNVVLTSYRRRPASVRGVMRPAHQKALATEFIERFDVKAPSTATKVSLLSGGNVQKVLLAREFSASPRILVAASPTRGLDVGAIEAVRARLVEAADNGVAIVLLSEDLEELLALADRILVLYEGRVVGEVNAADADIESIGLLMGGVSA
jgi:general nucleoside transport system ATP-binding protein